MPCDVRVPRCVGVYGWLRGVCTLGMYICEEAIWTWTWTTTPVPARSANGGELISHCMYGTRKGMQVCRSGRASSYV